MASDIAKVYQLQKKLSIFEGKNSKPKILSSLKTINMDEEATTEPSKAENRF